MSAAPTPATLTAAAYLDAWPHRDTTGHAAVLAVIDATLSAAVETAAPGTDTQNRETLTVIQTLTTLRRQLRTKPPAQPSP